MSYSISQNKATQKYIKNNYEEIKIRVQKGKKEQYKKFAKENGYSLNSFITNLIDRTIDETNNVIAPALKVKQTLSSMAIEDMYFSNDFIEKILKIANGEISSEEVRQEVLKQYAR